jgi:nucleotide-binding universal stress UspA family protein
VTCGAEDMPGPNAKQLASYLLHHGISTNRVQTKGRRIDKELMDTAQELGADLLVFGAYSRSRWRQIVFGGTSQFLLYEAQLPVLTLHT